MTYAPPGLQRCLTFVTPPDKQRFLDRDSRLFARDASLHRVSPVEQRFGQVDPSRAQLPRTVGSNHGADGRLRGSCLRARAPDRLLQFSRTSSWERLSQAPEIPTAVGRSRGGVCPYIKELFQFCVLLVIPEPDSEVIPRAVARQHSALARRHC